MTNGSSILAMIRTSPPHSLQVSMSISNIRFKRFAQVIEARFSACVWSASSTGLNLLRLPRLAGVTPARFLVTDPVSEAELMALRNKNVSLYLLRLDSVEGMLSSVVNSARKDQDSDYAFRMGERYDSLSKQEFARIAHEYMRPDDVVWVISGDLDVIGDDIRALDLGEVAIVE